MSKPEPISLDEFLQRLASERGVTRRIRLVARYWRQVKSLSPQDRERVALAVGSRVAWKQLERLFMRDGSLSDDERAVQEALDRLGDADPGELRRLAGVLREGDRRRVSELLVGAVQAALEEAAEPEAFEAAELEAPEPADREAPEVAEPGVSGTREEPHEEELAAIDAAHDEGEGLETASAPAAEVTRGKEEEAAATATAAATAAAAAAAAAAEEEEGQKALQAAPGPAAEPALRAATSGGREAERTGPPPSEPPIARPRSAGAGLADRRRRTPPPAIDRLRALRDLDRDPDRAVRLGRRGRRELVEALGPGWASRRAVSRMIRDGALSGVDEALQLIDRVGSPMQRSWCLGDLVDHLTLDGRALEKVLAAAPSPASRRRLARRASVSMTAAR